MILVNAVPGGYTEKGRFTQPDRAREKAWTHPVIANGKLYVRDQDLLLCYDVKAAK
jgi:hypothetical protein